MLIELYKLIWLIANYNSNKLSKQNYFVLIHTKESVLSQITFTMLPSCSKRNEAQSHNDHSIRAKRCTVRVHQVNGHFSDALKVLLQYLKRPRGEQGRAIH